MQVLIGRGLFLLFSGSFTFSAFRLLLVSFSFSTGVYGTEVTPVPFPNTEVKLCYEDDTWLATARETISMPALNEALLLRGAFLHTQK